jgi:Fic family protein
MSRLANVIGSRNTIGNKKDWEKFSYDTNRLVEAIYEFSGKVGHSKGVLSVLSKEQHTQTLLDVLVLEAIKTSEIEGEYLSRKDVLSSVKKNIGLVNDTDGSRDVRAKGIAEMVVEVHKTYNATLTEDVICEWHNMLFTKKTNITIGQWRTHTEPMQIVSGSIGKETIHFEAPPSVGVPKEMVGFIKWFNDSAPGGINEIKFAPIRAGIAHLYFESIHPFEDGNGRIGRAIAEKALLQTLGYPVLLSLSTTLEKNRNEYYSSLKAAQTSNVITEWLSFFTDTILSSLDASEEMIKFTLKKANFFDTYKGQINERQEKVIRKILDAGLDGYIGGMTAKKYMQITKVSKSTATRELQQLNELSIFKVIGKGRSTSYSLVLGN